MVGHGGNQAPLRQRQSGAVSVSAGESFQVRRNSYDGYRKEVFNGQIGAIGFDVLPGA